jgi:quinohemoprotein ethanol dehydrogenase
VDGVTGTLLWKYDPQDVQVAGRRLYGNWGTRGIAWWNGKILTATASGKVIALDARSGHVVWSEQVLEADDGSRFAAAPRVFAGIVVIGNSGDSGRVRGHVTALDAESGRRFWRYWLVPGDPGKGFEQPEFEMAAKTWSGTWWDFGGGGNPWNALTYDAETSTLLIGADNPFPYNTRMHSAAGSDNLFTSCIVAIDLKTGHYQWHYQGVPSDTWDYGMTQDMQLADLKIGSRQRKVLLTAAKNGFFYVIDRTNGALISAESFAKVTWASRIDIKSGRPVEVPGSRFESGSATIWPSSFGAHNWQPSAYSPRTRLVYIPVINQGMSIKDISATAAWDPDHGQVTTGVYLVFGVPNDDPQEGTAALLAWDPVKQKAVWRVPAPRMMPVGVMATGGDLVFQGAIDSTFNAYSARDGKRLWSFATRAPALSPPMSYSVNGRQYVTVLTGVGSQIGAWGRMLSSYQLDYRTMPRRVLTFALDGKATLPPAPVADFSKPADPDFRSDPARERSGASLYSVHCGTCHGYEAVSAGRAPELRRSAVPIAKESFDAVVRDGTLFARGMPAFALNDAEREAIRQYIRAQAHNPELDKESRFSGMDY